LAKGGVSGYYDYNENNLYIGTNQELRPLKEDDLILSGDLKKEEKKSLYFDYKFFARPEILFQIADDFNLDFSKYSLAEQVSFLQVIKKLSKDEMGPVKKFIGKYGENGFRSFLSVQSGGLEMGQKILSIGESYLVEDANRIFSKYAELVNVAEGVDGIFENEFKKNNQEVIYQIIEKLLLRGKKLLETFADSNTESVDSFLDKLEKIKGDNLLLIEKYRAMKSAGIIHNLEELSEISLDNLRGFELENNSELLDSLKRIYRENTSNISEEYAQSRIKKLEANLSLDNFSLKILRSGNKILSFLGVKEYKEGGRQVVEISAFNANKEFAEASGAIDILGDVLKDYETRGYIIRADALIRNARAYIQKNDFVAYDVEHLSGGVNLVLIEKDLRKEYETKNREIFTRKKIKEMANSESFSEGQKIVYQTTKDFDEVPSLLEENYLITQAFSEGNNIYYLLEKQ
jgi:hypothetical protein